MKLFKNCIILCFLGLLFNCDNRKNKLEFHKVKEVSKVNFLGLRNFTVIQINPNGKTVYVDWKGFNVKTGNAFNLPHEIITLTSGSEAYEIQPQKNNEININKKLYQFDSRNKHLLIKFGSGVSIENSSNFEKSLKWYDFDK